MRLLLSLVAGATSFLLLATPSAHACSCAPPPDADVAFGAAKFVFEGKAGAATPVTPAADGAPAGFATTEVSFEVLRSWKGGLSGTVKVKTAGSSAACGRSYNEGEAYLLYASAGEAGEPWDSLCSRTRPSKGSDDDFKVLDGLKTEGGGADTGDDKPVDGGGEASAGNGEASPDSGTDEAGAPTGDEGDASAKDTGADSTEGAGDEAATSAPAASDAGAKTDPVAPACAFAAASPTAGLAVLPLMAVARRRRGSI